MELLKANDKVVVEDGGVMPNLTVEKLAEGVRIARENQVAFENPDFPFFGVNEEYGDAIPEGLVCHAG